MESILSQINAGHGVTVKDVPAEQFIRAFANYLKKTGKFQVPDWAIFVKTSCQRELAPYDEEWLFVRAAAIARQLYIRRQTGITSLTDHFGRKERRGVKSEHHRRASKKIIRYCLQQLGSLDLVGIVKFVEDGKETLTEGRQITKKGIQDMDRVATMVNKQN